jgi:pimeloyl-ACP methyl ester carboxylesterase
VFASSPAVWDTDPGGGAFDSAADFARHDVLARSAALRGQPVRIWCGASDPLQRGARQLAERVPGAILRISEGCHDPVFWEHLAPDQLRLAAAALS